MMKQLSILDKNLPTEIFDYHPNLFTKEESAFYMRKLIDETAWEHKKVLMYGKEVITPRLTAWYTSSWTKELLQIKERVENLSSIHFNSVLLNYYRDGNDSVAWHSDDDGVPGKNKFVASVSFGEERLFDIRSKNDHTNKFSILLENGSYLLMKNDFQENWQHRIAKSKLPMKQRLNLTFRIIQEAVILIAACYTIHLCTVN
jgi:alkylated DNA repair dioxygenase AlkB